MNGGTLTYTASIPDELVEDSRDELPHSRDGSRLLFRLSHLDAYLENR